MVNDILGLSGPHQRSSTIKHYISGLQMKDRIQLIEFATGTQKEQCRRRTRNCTHTFEFLEAASCTETQPCAEPRAHVHRTSLQPGAGVESHEEMGRTEDGAVGGTCWESSLPLSGQDPALPPQPSPSHLTAGWQADQNKPAEIIQFNYL